MKRNVFLMVLVIIGFILSDFLSMILYFFDPNWSSYLPDNKFLWSTMWVFLKWIPIFLVAIILSGKKCLSELGLNANFPKAFLYALLFTAPMFIGFVFFGKLNLEFSAFEVLNNCIYPGFYEELLFRCFLMGILFTRFKWGFIPASLFSSVFFGIGHLYQGHDLMGSLSAFFVTAAGSIWFGWLYLEWRSNAWINISLHVLMNFSWLLFTVEGGATGNIIANVLRVFTIALSIYVTIRMQSKKKGFVVKRQTLWINKTNVKPVL